MTTDRAGAEKDDTEFDDSQRLVHTDPTLKMLATSFLACGPEHYAGAGTDDPSVLEWAAWDAWHAMNWGRENGRGGVLAAMEDSGFYHPHSGVPSCLEDHIDAVLAAIQ